MYNVGIKFICIDHLVNNIKGINLMKVVGNMMSLAKDKRFLPDPGRVQNFFTRDLGRGG